MTTQLQTSQLAASLAYRQSSHGDWRCHGAGRAAPGESTIEQNKRTARRWSEELWGRGNLAVADEIIAPDYERHDPGDPFPARGPQDVKRIVPMLRRCCRTSISRSKR